MAISSRTVGIALSAAASLMSPAVAQDARPDRIKIEYVAPANPAHQPIYDLLKQHTILERAQTIFSPFKFPVDVTIRTVGCNGVINAWYQRPTVTICYEYLADIRNHMPSGTTLSGATPQDGVIGQFFYVLAHEMGHAVFDLLNVPLFGRPEDAADQFAAYMMLQVGRDQARRLIVGAAYAYQRYLRNPKVVVPKTAFSSVHGAPLQRFYNLLCIAFGADRKTFADLVDIGYLPKTRARGCRVEFGELNFAFQNLVVPKLDRERAKAVLDTNWVDLLDQAASDVSPASRRRDDQTN
jgi:hypothetical protein